MAKKLQKKYNMPKKILVIDDDGGILEAFEAMLTSVGYEVEISTDPDSLQKRTKNMLPDLLLLDVLLSGRDGREICKQLKSQPETKELPIIMISAHPGAGTTIKDAGADDFLPKPFEMDDLLKKIAKYTT